MLMRIRAKKNSFEEPRYTTAQKPQSTVASFRTWQGLKEFSCIGPELIERVLKKRPCNWRDLRFESPAGELYGEKGIRSPVVHVVCTPYAPPAVADAHIVCALPRLARRDLRFESPAGELYGEKGIRTPGTFRYATFPRLYLKPLGHLSKV